MKAFNELVSFADENGLKIWTKDIITELGDLVIVTELNRICATFHGQISRRVGTRNTYI